MQNIHQSSAQTTSRSAKGANLGDVRRPEVGGLQKGFQPCLQYRRFTRNLQNIVFAESPFGTPLSWLHVVVGQK